MTAAGFGWRGPAVQAAAAAPRELHRPADLPDVNACGCCGGVGHDEYGRTCVACGGSGIDVEPVGSGSAGGVEGHARAVAKSEAQPEVCGTDRAAGVEPGPALLLPTDPDAWMDGPAGPVPSRWDLERERVRAEAMWQPGIWIERDVVREVYVVVEVGPPRFGAGPSVDRRDYVALTRAQRETERRCLISAWLPDGPRLVGYRAPSWRRPSR